jgi:hypothetical protein
MPGKVRKPRTASAEKSAESFRRTHPLIAGVLERAALRDGCVLCRAVHDIEERALFSFLYEGMTIQPARERFVHGGGFCPHHFRMALKQARAAGYVGPFEIASLCQLLLNAGLQRDHLVQAKPEGGKWPGFRRKAPAQDFTEPGENCMLCADSSGKEKNLVAALEALTTDAAIAERVEKDGLCQRHGTMALQTWEATEHREWLNQVLSRQRLEIKRLVDEFLRKHDHRFRQESAGPESDAVRRALQYLLGTEAAEEAEDEQGQ